MKKNYATIVLVLLFGTASFGQQSGKDKILADSLVNEWNVRFDSDNPTKIEELLAENVCEISGEISYYGRDSVMINFVKKRMPVISNLKAVNEFYSVSKDMIYTAGKYTLKVKRSETETAEAIGNYTFIWTRQKDNKFKIEFIHLESIPKK